MWIANILDFFATHGTVETDRREGSKQPSMAGGKDARASLLYSTASSFPTHEWCRKGAVEASA
jgi:hypothetical protein